MDEAALYAHMGTEGWPTELQQMILSDPVQRARVLAATLLRSSSRSGAAVWSGRLSACSCLVRDASGAGAMLGWRDACVSRVLLAGTRVFWW
jgi:hypothetical protein